MDGQALFVGGHRDVVEIEFLAALEAFEVVHDERPGQFSRAVAAVVVEDERIAVTDGGAGS